MEDFIVSTHISSLAASVPTTVPIRTIRQHLPLPQPHDQNNIPNEHAIFSSLIDSEATGTILLRLIHGGLIVELVSLSTDVAPLRLVFPASLLDSPSMFMEDSKLHVLAVTEFGSLYRLIVPIDGRNLWRNRADNVWPKEYLITNLPQDTRGCFVQAQGPYCIGISLPNGSLLRLEANSLGYDGHEGMSWFTLVANFSFIVHRVEEWAESVFSHSGLLSSFTSLLPGLHSADPHSADIVSLATHPWPSKVPYIWTLSRDRTLRLWKSNHGCVASKGLPFLSHSLETSRASSSTGAGSHRSHPLLDAARQTLLKVFTIDGDSGQDLYILAFIPSITSIASGGFFCLLDTKGEQLREVAVFEASKRTVHCHLQDFIVVNKTLVTLWESQGRSAVEKVNLDFKALEGSAFQPIWKAVSYAQEPELTPAYMEEKLLSPGSLAEKFLEAIFQPGVFSSLSLRAAIDQYTDVCLSLPGAPPPQLMTTYSTLCENVAAVVGCMSALNRDPQTGAFLYSNYWTALKRDWEGFVARCREVERSARWPLILGSRGPEDVIIIERERAGSLVLEDMAIYLYRLMGHGRLADASLDVLTVSGALRQKFGLELMAAIEGRALDLVHQEFAFSLVDLLQEQANRLQIKESVDEGFAAWISGRLQSIGDLNKATRAASDAIGALDYVVKREDDETDLSALVLTPQSDWSRCLTARYIAIAVEARYEMALSLFAFLLYLAPDLGKWDSSLIAEVFALFKGTAMLRYVCAQPAERPGKESRDMASSPEDEVISRLRSMDVAHSRVPSTAPTSLIYLLLSQTVGAGTVPAIAHSFLDQSGLLQSISPWFATHHEVAFCERLRLLKFFGVARELLSCLPRTSAAAFVLAQVWLQIGRFDEAAQLFERLGGSFGAHIHSSTFL